MRDPLNLTGKDAPVLQGSVGIAGSGKSQLFDLAHHGVISKPGLLHHILSRLMHRMI